MKHKYHVFKMEEKFERTQITEHPMLNKAVSLNRCVAGEPLEVTIENQKEKFMTSSKISKVYNAETVSKFDVLIIETWKERIYLMPDTVFKIAEKYNLDKNVILEENKISQ